MSMAHLAPEIFDQVHMLLDHEKADPESFFENVFIDYKLHELKDFLWDALEVCLTTDDAPFENAETRKDATLYMYYVIKCLEAGKLIADRKDKLSAQPNPEEPEVKYKNVDSLTQNDLTAAHEYYSEKLAFFLTKYQEVVHVICRIINRMMKERNETKETVG